MFNNGNDSSTPTTTVVNEIIEALNEREAGYRKAADLSKDSEAAELFHKYAVQSSLFARELIAYSNEHTPEEVGQSPLSAVFRGWAELKSALTGHDTKSLYAWCETGEDTAINIYNGAFKAGLPTAVKD
ncbi:MAG TPA: DUF2383 domain-containing protein, partial [Cytophagaceae bacterium]